MDKNVGASASGFCLPGMFWIQSLCEFACESYFSYAANSWFLIVNPISPSIAFHWRIKTIYAKINTLKNTHWPQTFCCVSNGWFMTGFYLSIYFLRYSLCPVFSQWLSFSSVYSLSILSNIGLVVMSCFSLCSFPDRFISSLILRDNLSETVIEIYSNFYPGLKRTISQLPGLPSFCGEISYSQVFALRRVLVFLPLTVFNNLLSLYSLGI